MVQSSLSSFSRVFFHAEVSDSSIRTHALHLKHDPARSDNIKRLSDTVVHGCPSFVSTLAWFLMPSVRCCVYKAVTNRNLSLSRRRNFICMQGLLKDSKKGRSRHGFFSARESRKNIAMGSMTNTTSRPIAVCSYWNAAEQGHN